MKLPTVVTILVLCGVEYGLLGLAFELSAVQRAVMAALTFACLLLSVRRSVYPFYIVLLSGATVFIALTCGLGSPYRGDSPLSLNVVLGPWPIFLSAAVLAGAALWFYEREPVPRRFPLVLAAAFAVDWVLLSVNVAHFQDWVLENVLTVPFALLIVLTHKWFRLSNVSYGLIFVYMVLHVIGTHYTYGGSTCRWSSCWPSVPSTRSSNGSSRRPLAATWASLTSARRATRGTPSKTWPWPVWGR